MKFKKIIVLVSVLFVHGMSFVCAIPVCEPDQSIENQKLKKISQEAQALLVKIMKDKISFSWPVEVCKCWVSSLFGPRGSGFHNGVDFAAHKGTPVYAIADGIVDLVQHSLDKNGYGNMVLLDHKNIITHDALGSEMSYKSRYAHLDTILIKQGDKVKKNQQIGTVGSTGHVIIKSPKSDPSHLHFEIYRGQTRINPLIALFSSDKTWVKNNE